MAYEIIDNFLPEEEHQIIVESLMGASFPWYLTPQIVSDVQDNARNFQFVHNFHKDYGWSSDLAYIIGPLIDKIKPEAIIRVKANLNPYTETPYKGGWHVDYPFPCKTSVYYVNTNNGYTELVSGEIIESVANRLVIFDSDTLHTGVTCTDAKARCVININYFD